MLVVVKVMVTMATVIMVLMLVTPVMMTEAPLPGPAHGNDAGAPQGSRLLITVATRSAHTTRAACAVPVACARVRTRVRAVHTPRAVRAARAAPAAPAAARRRHIATTALPS